MKNNLLTSNLEILKLQAANRRVTKSLWSFGKTNNTWSLPKIRVYVIPT